MEKKIPTARLNPALRTWAEDEGLTYVTEIATTGRREEPGFTAYQVGQSRVIEAPDGDLTWEETERRSFAALLAHIQAAASAVATDEQIGRIRCAQRHDGDSRLERMVVGTVQCTGCGHTYTDTEVIAAHAGVRGQGGLIVAGSQGQFCRRKRGHVEGSGYMEGRLYQWEGKCNGTVRLTDTVTGAVEREDNEDFDLHFEQVFISLPAADAETQEASDDYDAEIGLRVAGLR